MADIILNDEDILLPFTEETPVHESFMNPIINCINKNTTRSKENTSAIGQKADKTQITNPNLIINPDFPIWQRGTSFGSGVYSADRWIAFSATGGVQVTRDTDNSLKISASKAEFAGITQVVEGKYRDLLGQKVTISAKVKSTIPILLSVETNGTTVDSAVFPASAGYTVISKTVTLPASINENTLRALIVGNQQIGTINVAWVKLELGDIATSFSPRSYAEELAMCQRYYEKFRGSGNLTVLRFCGSPNVLEGVSFKINKRIVPTMLLYSETGEVGKVTNASASPATSHSANIVFVSEYGFRQVNVPGIPSGQMYAYGFEADAEIY